MKKTSWKLLSDAERGLLNAAAGVRRNAYAPYSRFKVGAAVLSASGRVFPGCNVESADYTLTTHAEMAAIDAMVTAGDRVLAAVAVCLPSSGAPPVPCGLCRQKMTEFSGPTGVSILCAGLGRNGRIRSVYRTSLRELLPYPFTKKNLR